MLTGKTKWGSLIINTAILSNGEATRGVGECRQCTSTATLMHPTKFTVFLEAMLLNNTNKYMRGRKKLFPPILATWINAKDSQKNLFNKSWLVADSRKSEQPYRRTDANRPLATIYRLTFLYLNKRWRHSTSLLAIWFLGFNLILSYNLSIPITIYIW